MDILYSIVRFFVTGGAFMYPILIVFAVGLAVAIERYITLTLVTKQNQEVWNKIQPLLTKGEFDNAYKLTEKDDSTIAQVAIQRLLIAEV